MKALFFGKPPTYRYVPLCSLVCHVRVTERSSPLSLKVIFEQVKRGGGMDLEQCLDDEFSVNAHLFGLPDFETAMQARESGVRRDIRHV